MPLFSRKPECPACGQKALIVENGMWACRACIANGPLSSGQPLDLGLRGNPRGGEFEQYAPTVPVAAQLAPQAPEQFAPLLADSEATERFNQAAFGFFAAFTGTSFDLEDEELEQAQAMQARTGAGDPNLRADDPRFYLLTACSQNGWQWRRAEEREDGQALIPEVRDWLARYQRENGEAQSRSEVISLTAMAIVDTQALELRLHQDSDVGYASLLGGWLLSYWILLAPQPQLLKIHPSELLINTFRFGVALRDAEIAYDLSAASQSG